MDQVYVNQAQAARLVDCSRNNFSKMWKKEKEFPGSHSFFSSSGKIDISDPEFIEHYGDHTPEWNPPIKKTAQKKTPAAPPPKTEPKKRGRPPGTKKKKEIPEPTPPVKEKTRTAKQQEQDKKKEEVEEEKRNAAKDPELAELTKKANRADKITKINKSQQSEIDLRKSRAELVLIESLGETCMGYLAALNQNIMEMPNTFFDELEASIKAKKTRSEKIDIVRGPICTAISDTKKAITKELERAQRSAKLYERKHNIKAPK